MKSLILASILLPFAFAGVVPQIEKKVDYAGFKVLRLTLANKNAKLEAKIDELTAHVLNPGKAEFLDVVVSPANVDAVVALAVKSVVINENVGLPLEKEEDQVSILAGPFSFSILLSECALTRSSACRKLVYRVPPLCRPSYLP